MQAVELRQALDTRNTSQPQRDFVAYWIIKRICSVCKLFDGNTLCAVNGEEMSGKLHTNLLPAL